MKRIQQLSGVRGLAILAVFLHHAFKLKLMWMGVDLFFILSGFLITGVLLSAKQHTLRGYFARFYARRARRILAPYLLALAVMSCFVGVAWARHWYFYIVLTNLLLPLHIPHPLAFDPLWSLAVEEQFYLVWPFAVYFLSERRLGWFAFFMVVLAPILRGCFHFQQPWPVYMLTPFRMDLLAAGALLCLGYRHMRQHMERWGAVAGALLALCGVAGLLGLARYGIGTFDNTRVGNVWIYECALFCCLGVMLWALSGRGVGLLRWRPLGYLGQISYSMYLVHLGVILLFASRLRALPAGAAAFAVTVGYASLSWYLMERWLLSHNPGTKTPLPAHGNGG